MLSKRKKESLGKYDIEKLYSVDEACALLKEISSSKKFDESIDYSENIDQLFSFQLHLFDSGIWAIQFQ